MHRDDVIEALHRVTDPELGIDVVELGLVYEVELQDGAVRVVLGVTSPACPLGPHLAAEAEAAIRARCPEAESVSVRYVLDPAWEPSRMSAAARRALGEPD